MAADDLRGFSSAFDDMLARSRQEFDALLSSSGTSPAAQPTASNSISRLSPREAVDTALQIYGQSDSARRLTERFGSGWRCEIVERQRQADEVIALCKLKVPGQNIVRSQFGVASVRDVAGRDEQAAYYAAVSEALESCAATLV